MSLNPFLMAQVKFVVEALKNKTSAERVEMFAEIEKHYCIICGDKAPCRVHPPTGE